MQHPTPHRNKVLGFTAIELMVCVAIVAILMAIALPSFRNSIERWRVNQYLGEFESTIFKARSEAIKRGGNVFIQKLPDNSATACNRATTSQDWGCGWFIYYSARGISPHNGTDPILQSYPESKKTTLSLLLGSSGATTIKLERWGNINGISALSVTGTPVLGANEPTRNQKTLCLSSGGRLLRQDDGPPCPGA